MDIKKNFNQKYKTNPQTFGNEVMPIVKTALTHISSGNALELGVGNGRNTLFLLSKSFKVTGVDLSEEGINILKERSKNNPNLKLIIADVMEYKADTLFEMVLAIGLLHFLDETNIKKLITKMKNVTGVGGVNVIATRMTQNLRNSLPYVFKHNELANFYKQNDWVIKKYEELDRKNAKIATLIAQKIA